MPELSETCRTCAGYCGMMHSPRDAQQERAALKVGIILYGTPLMAMMAALFLLSGWQGEVASGIEIAALVLASVAGYGGAALYLRRHYKIPLG